MSDVGATIVLLGVLLSVAFLAVAVRTAARWHRLHSVRLVTCPETDAPAAITVSGVSAAINAVFDTPFLWLSACSRWPSRRSCDQACLQHADAASDGARVRVIAGQWFGSRPCAYCRQPISLAHDMLLQPALLGCDTTTRAWTDVPPEQLPALFRTHLPVCCNCYLAETFRRRHPELVTDR